MTAAVLSARRWLAADGDPARRAQRTIGFLVVAAGLAAMTGEALGTFYRWIGSNPAVAPALIATAVTATATALGALPVLAARGLSHRVESSLLGFGAGVMLAATAFSLVVPGIESATVLSGGRFAAVAIVGVALALGGLTMLALDRAVPHEHFVKGVEGGRAKELKRIWLFVAAIALHNVPEGLAVGVGFGGGDVSNGIPLAFGIAVQNIPEGLVVAVALVAAGYAPWFGAAVAALTGLLEPLGGLFGAGVLGISETVLPWGLGFAAGAMLFVVSHEIIPESHRKGHERHATLGLITGFVLMMSLDTTLS
jgi:ZIP family zinc transporter